MPKLVNTKRKITTLFNAFSKKERKQFFDFVRSPYFNTDQTLVKLTLYLDKSLTNKIEERLTSTHLVEAFTLMFGKPESKLKLDKNEQSKLNDKLYILTKLGYKFLLVNALNEESPEHTSLLLKQLNQSKYATLFEAMHRKKYNRLKQTEEFDNEYFLQNYQLERNLYEFRFNFDQNKLIKSDNLEKVIEASDTYYLIERMLLHLSGMSLLSNLGTKSYDFELMKWIFKLSESPKYNSIPAIKLCRIACRMETSKLLSREHTEEDLKAQHYYQELVNLLKEYDECFTADFKDMFYGLAINFCSHQTRRNRNKEFYEEGYKLYHQLELKGLMVKNDRVRASRLTLAMSFACLSGNSVWAEEMRKKYIDKVDKPIRHALSSFILGQIAFYDGKFKKADDYFLKAEDQQHRSFTNNCKVFRLRCLYEINEYSFEAANVRFKSEIALRKKSKSLSKNARVGQTNFIKVLSDLYNIRDSLRRQSKSSLLKRLTKTEGELNAYPLVSDVLWLEKKIAELRKQLL